jgi:hypothetical protein
MPMYSVFYGTKGEQQVLIAASGVDRVQALLIANHYESLGYDVSLEVL